MSWIDTTKQKECLSVELPQKTATEILDTIEPRNPSPMNLSNIVVLVEGGFQILLIPNTVLSITAILGTEESVLCRGGMGVVWWGEGGGTFLFENDAYIVANKYATQSKYISIKQKPKINVQKKTFNKTKRGECRYISLHQLRLPQQWHNKFVVCIT